MNNKTRVKRVPKRGIYDKESIYKIIDKNYYCHVSFVHEDYPVVIPTACGRMGDQLVIHGSTASSMMKDLAEGIDCCVAITKMTGLVLAKSVFHHSMNYESVVIFGKAVLVENREEKMEALKIFTDKLLPGRWDEAREPSEIELKATSVLKIPLDECSAKSRTGLPSDDPADNNLPIWTGTLNLKEEIGTIDVVNESYPMPKSVKNLMSKY